MEHQHTNMDAESLQRSERRRGGCLHVSLVASIVFLFLALTAVAVLGTMAVMDPRTNEAALTASPPYKMQNFAYLQAISSTLMNHTMNWDVVKYGEGKSLGSNFKFDSGQQALQPLQPGTYFIFIYVNLTCTFRCSAGLLTLHFGDKLTCEVKLPAGTESVSKKCWTVSRMDRQRLVTQMTVSMSTEEPQCWKLEPSSSGLGMFLMGQD